MAVYFLLLFFAFPAFFPTRSLSCFPAGKEVSDTLQPASSLSVFSYENVRDYLFQNLHYPPAAVDSNIQGTVMLHFTITPSGRIDSVRITRPLHPLLDAEAVRLFREMPQWKPIIHQNNPISVDYEIPVIFELTEKNDTTGSVYDKK